MSCMDGRDRLRFRTRKAGMLEVIARDGASLRARRARRRWCGRPRAEQLRRRASPRRHRPARHHHPRRRQRRGRRRAVSELDGRRGDRDRPACRTQRRSEACKPDMARLREIEMMVIVTAPGGSGEDEGHDVVSRVFVPAWGVDEDPVTGSAHAALTPFLVRPARPRQLHRLPGKPPRRAGRVPARGRPGGPRRQMRDRDGRRDALLTPIALARCSGRASPPARRAIRRLARQDLHPRLGQA